MENVLSDAKTFFLHISIRMGLSELIQGLGTVAMSSLCRPGSG